MSRRAQLGAIVFFLIISGRGFSATTGPVASVYLTAGWATFGQAVPDGMVPAGSGLQISGLPTQTDVKNRWPDGSIRFAIVTVNAPEDRFYDVSSGDGSGDAFDPSVLPSAEVRLSIYRDTVVEISGITVGTPTQLTTSTPHGLTSGDVILINWSSSTPSLDGPQTVTVIDPASFSVPVAVTQVCRDPDWVCTIGGRFVRPNASKSLYVATLPDALSSDRWLNGPNVYEGRSAVAPVTTTGDPHPFLRVIFDTRVYSDGKYRVDATVENVLDQPDAITVWYDVDVRIGGVSKYTHTIGAMAVAPVEHYYLTRWRKTFSNATFAAITPDIKPFNLARALPLYLDLVYDGPLQAHELTTSVGYDILRSGALHENMYAHGGRQELGPFPDWTARYLVHKHQGQREIVLANGDLAGSWPIHVRESETGAMSGVGPERLVSLEQRPTFWYGIQGRQEGEDGNTVDGQTIDYLHGEPMPIKENGAVEPDHDQSGLIPDNAHQPSIAYVPYLLTGDRYYAEEMAFWANYGMLRTNPLDGVRVDKGILENQEVRGYAWALRNLADAAAYYPDGSDVKAYLSDKVMHNLNWLDNMANTQDPVTNPLKILWAGHRDESGDQEFGFSALWEQNYLAYAIDRANKQGFNAGGAHRDAIAKFQLMLFTDPGYPLTTILDVDTYMNFSGEDFTAGAVLPWGAPFLVNVSSPTNRAMWWDSSSGPLFTTMTDIAAANIADPTNHRPYSGFYGPEARLNLLIAKENEAASLPGWAGAAAAHSYLFQFIGVNDAACGHFGDDIPDLACRAGWALGEYPLYTPPPPPTGDEDTDGDGVNDDVDNCPAALNANQDDTDVDGIGDACDPVNNVDFDNDGTVDEADADDDGDGQSDADEVACSSNPRNASSKSADADNDGIPNCVDPVNNVDFDNDGILDGADTDDDADGQSDADELACVSNPRDASSKSADADNDGIPNCVDTSNSADFDNDGILNAADPDDDNDGQTDVDEIASGSDPLNAASKATDTDGDKRPDFVDPDDDNDGRLDGVDPRPLIANVAPTVTVPSQSSVEDTAITPLQILASDPDGDALTYSASGLPPGLSLPFGTKAIVGTPTKPGHYNNVKVSVSDGKFKRSATFTWVVVEAPLPPIELENPGPQTSTEEQWVSLQLEWKAVRLRRRDHHPRQLHFAAFGLPNGLHIHDDGTISGRVGPRAASSQPYSVTVTLRVGKEKVSQTFKWTILNKNRAPWLRNIHDQSSKVGSPDRLELDATDPDGDTLFFTHKGLPPGLSMSPAGVISGTVGGSAKEYHVTVTVSDGRLSESETFHWNVTKKDDKGKK